jgi:deoxycytidine triphosphate deaminase
MLNAKQIVDEGLLLLENTQGKPAQVGYDLSLKAVQKIGNKIGYNVFKDGQIGKVLKDKTVLTTYLSIDPIMLEGNKGWLLHDGVYDITFNEGCKIPDNRVAFIKQRSSLYRNGATINSPVFDPGFETEFMGTLLYVHEPLFIELNARVAQIYFHECSGAELYNGQWQNDKQRNSL